MRAVDIIEKKKQGLENTKDEIDFFINSYMKGEIEDYQVSAWLMAVCLKGLSFDETVYLTDAFIKSGDVMDFSDFEKRIADKHSTGGVGDKVTLVLIPLLASLGIPCAKLSGRGLGMTGGTIDKLESIKGFNCMLSEEKFKNQIKEINAAISAQTPNLVPADGKIYALRDVTATVDNKSLICASVVSKKIASGADIIVLDVKYGNGAFIKTKEEAKELSDLMKKVGERLNKKIDAVISSMEQPLGKTVGNSLEVIEAIEFLKGKKISHDLYDITLEIATKTIVLANLAPDYPSAKKMVDEALLSGAALEKFREIIKAQDGDPAVIDDYSLLGVAENYVEVRAQKDEGYVQSVNALEIAHACKILGGGRERKTDKIDFNVGCIIYKKQGSQVLKNDNLATIHYNKIEESKLKEALGHVMAAYKFGPEKIERIKVIAK